MGCMRSALSEEQDLPFVVKKSRNEQKLHDNISQEITVCTVSEAVAQIKFCVFV